MLMPNSVVLNRYRIVRAVGIGSQGTVYEAADQVLNRTVALKNTLHTEDFPEEVLSSEARLLAGLSKHPALPTIFDCFIENGSQYLVMEFVPGDDLSQMLKHLGKGFPIDQVIEWADRLLSALEFLHSGHPPIVHRDIKPQNLKINNRGEIVLLDFGLAKNQKTGTVVSGFTVAYAPLEQLQGLPTDARSDLYALAATLYHLSTNVKPVDAMTRHAAFERFLPDPLLAPRELNPDIPVHISQALMKALSLDSDLRPSGASEFRRLLLARQGPIVLPDEYELSTVTKLAQRLPLSNQTEEMRHSILGRTTGHILSLGFSPNGKTVACGDWDQTISLWDIGTGERRILRCEGPVNCVSFSPDGEVLASASKTIDLWDAKTGERLKQIKQFGFCVTFSPNGRWIGWSSKSSSEVGGVICIWDRAEKDPEVLGVSERWIRSVAFSPNGRILASGSWDASQSICFWDVDRRQQFWHQGTKHGVNSVAFSADGLIVAAGGQVINLVTIRDNKVRTIGTSEDVISSIVFSPDNKFICSGGKGVCNWDTISGERHKLRESEDHINSVAISPDGLTIAAGGNDNVVSLIRVR